MQIELQRIPPPASCYGGPLPERMAWLHPDAAASFAELGDLVISDMYRDAASSREAREKKAGVQPPGYSAHGYGLAIDVAVDETLARLGCGYPELLIRLRTRGWWAHRRDGERGREDWHFNWLGPRAGLCLAAATSVPATWSHVAEANILLVYPELGRRMEPEEIQEALQSLWYYRGPIDGELGPVSKDAAERFAQAWHCHPHGQGFERTLRFVAASTVRT